jgi:endonuclease/exonuclease/phosphatase family metal-dependent hydrolase
MRGCIFSGVLWMALLLAHSSVAICQEPVENSMVVRILTFNILHGETLQGDFDLDLIANVIRQADPDLVALQEVDFRTLRARNMDLVGELGQRTGLIPLFGRAMFYDGGEYGEGILSRYSFLSTRNHALPAGEGKEPRAALEVQVLLPGKDTLIFVGTHLDHTRNEADRLAQAARLKALFTDGDKPMILCGDLNARPESAPMKLLFSEWTESDTEHSPTIPSNEPRAKIDYVLYKPAHRWKVIESRVICDSIASDHCAQLSVLELLPAPPVQRP